MNKIKSLLGLAAAGMIAAALAGPAAAADDVLLKKGAKVYKTKCKVCHNKMDKVKNLIGPHLATVMGRTSGTLEGYKKYSKAMKAAAKVWDETTLNEYLIKPKAYVPGTKMILPGGGLKKEKHRKAVIAYIISKQKK